MEDRTSLETLAQASSEDFRKTIRQYTRGFVRELILSVMSREVALLCGEKYHPNQDADCQRAGSAPGRVIIDSKPEPITRPRVRQKKSDGGTQEVHLKSYATASNPDELQRAVFTALKAGVSTRDQREIHPKSNVSKSQVSRLWIQEGNRMIQELRSRDLSQETWIALMMDGLYLSKDITAVTALGITLDGRKIILDFQLGSTENYEVCRDLVKRLVRRGFGPEPGYRLFSALDGSDALKKAIRTFFEDAVIQRCQVHKQRNVKRYLSKKDWGEADRLFDRLRKQEGKKATREAYDELKRFLESKNRSAYKSLLEAGDDLIAMQLLGVPSTLNVSLLSTNLIENPYRMVRRKIGRVTRFRAETDQASRWMATALLEAEKGFRRIRGYEDLKALHRKLRRVDAPSGSGSKVSDGAAPDPSPPSPSVQCPGATDGDGDEVSGAQSGKPIRDVAMRRKSR